MLPAAAAAAGRPAACRGSAPCSVTKITSCSPPCFRSCRGGWHSAHGVRSWTRSGCMHAPAQPADQRTHIWASGPACCGLALEAWEGGAAALGCGVHAGLAEHLPADAVQPFLHDCSLRRWYSRGRKVALDVATGLAYLHHRRVLHLVRAGLAPEVLPRGSAQSGPWPCAAAMLHCEMQPAQGPAAPAMPCRAMPCHAMPCHASGHSLAPPLLPRAFQDLKPHNVLLGRHGEAKIGDVGVSRRAGAGCRSACPCSRDAHTPHAQLLRMQCNALHMAWQC